MKKSLQLAICIGFACAPAICFAQQPSGSDTRRALTVAQSSHWVTVKNIVGATRLCDRQDLANPSMIALIRQWASLHRDGRGRALELQLDRVLREGGRMRLIYLGAGQGARLASQCGRLDRAPLRRALDALGVGVF